MNIERRFKMKRFSAMVVVLGMVAILAGLALAAEKGEDARRDPQAFGGQVAVGIGWSWGKGVLTLKGKTTHSKSEGSPYSTWESRTPKAEGKIYNLRSSRTSTGRTCRPPRKPLWASSRALRR